MSAPRTRRRTRYVSIDVEVEVDIVEHIGAIPTDDLVDELSQRKDVPKLAAAMASPLPVDYLADQLREILHELRMGRSDHARRMIDDLIEQTFRVQQAIALATQRGELVNN